MQLYHSISFQLRTTTYLVGLFTIFNAMKEASEFKLQKKIII